MQATTIGLVFIIRIHEAQASMEAADWTLGRITQDVYDLDPYIGNPALKLFRARLCFNVLNDDALLNGKMAGGSLVIGKTAYDTLILPNIHYLPLRVAKQLKRLQYCGIRLVFLDAVPNAGMTDKEHQKVRALCQSLAVGNRYSFDADWISFLKQRASLAFEGPESEHVFVTKFKRGNTTLYYCINTLPEAVELSMALSNSVKAELFNPETGSLEPIQQGKIIINGWRGVFILQSEQKGNR